MRNRIRNAFESLKNLKRPLLLLRRPKLPREKNGRPAGPVTWGLLFAQVVLVALFLALVVSWAVEWHLEGKLLEQKRRYASFLSTRPPSFMNIGRTSSLEAFADVNPFDVSKPPAGVTDAASADAAKKTGDIDSMMLVGTLPRIGAWIRIGTDTQLVLQGQDYRGYTLEVIDPGRALLSKQGENFPLYIALSGSPKKQETAATPEPDSRGGARIVMAKPGGPPGILPREILDKLLMNPYEEMAKVRIRALPNQGLEVVNIQPGSLLASLGVQTGDIIKALNGVNISTLADFSNAANSMMGGSKMDITVARGGSKGSLNYNYVVK